MSNEKQKAKELTAENLKSALWETLLEVKSKQVDPIVANSVAFQSRELMRVVKTQLLITKMSGKKPGPTLVKFSGSKGQTSAQVV